MAILHCFLLVHQRVKPEFPSSFEVLAPGGRAACLCLRGAQQSAAGVGRDGPGLVGGPGGPVEFTRQGMVPWCEAGELTLGKKMGNI